MFGSTGSFSEEKESELIKLAGFLENEDLESVEYYLDNLKTDVRDEVIGRILDFSRQCAREKALRENVRLNLS
jgi:hypothetical protein